MPTLDRRIVKEIIFEIVTQKETQFSSFPRDGARVSLTPRTLEEIDRTQRSKL